MMQENSNYSSMGGVFLEVIFFSSVNINSDKVCHGFAE